MLLFQPTPDHRTQHAAMHVFVIALWLVASQPIYAEYPSGIWSPYPSEHGAPRIAELPPADTFEAPGESLFAPPVGEPNARVDGWRRDVG
jgi:hypothetical protein